MKKYIRLFFLFELFVLIGCDSRPKGREIIISGVVVDSINNEPIKDARVTILCWKRVGIDDVTYEKIDTITDDRGSFLVRFNEGYKVDVAAVGKFYSPAAKGIEFLEPETKVNLKLFSNSNTPHSIRVQELPLAIRQYNTSTNKSFATVGINLIEGVTSLTQSSCDLWVELNDDDSSLIVTTLENGGIQPIFNDNILTAPVDGYVQQYKVTGNEKGFFIRCRDGKKYGRLIIFSSEYEKSSPNGDGFFVDKGMMFKTYLNTEGKLDFNILPLDVSLEQYILENI
jgi:hypothetical protein